MRILLGFILALSVSFACDQPHEEVGGYKIGCPFDDKAGFNLDETDASGKLSYYSKIKDGLFNVVVIATLDGLIEYVELGVDGRVIPQKDADSIMHSLAKRWGDPVEVSNVGYNAKWIPRSETIAKISFFGLLKEETMTLTYESKKYMSFAKNNLKTIAEQREDELNSL